MKIYHLSGSWPFTMLGTSQAMSNLLMRPTYEINVNNTVWIYVHDDMSDRLMVAKRKYALQLKLELEQVTSDFR